MLGSAAGGGLPQWNCACANCQGAREGRLKPRGQASIAASGDGARWLLVNASPDVRAQIEATPALRPRRPGRGSPITDVVLTSADADCVAGLLTLRESPGFTLHATRPVLAPLARNPILRLDRLRCRELAPDRSFEAAGLTVSAFAVPGKPPLWLEGEAAPDPLDVVGLDLDGRAVFAPACASLPAAVADRLKGAPLVLFDGTLWRDDEMAAHGGRSGRAMGHLSLSGPDGALTLLSELGIGRKILIHLNNTNPALDPASPEAALVRAAGFEIAEDGMELSA